MSLMNTFSILFIAATALSHLLQYRRMLSLRSSAGISITSALLCALVGHVQAATMFYLFKASPQMEDGNPVATPPSTRDWINVTQILVQWICSLVYFALAIYLPGSASASAKKTAVSIYAAHSLLTLLFILLFINEPGKADNFNLFNIFLNVNASVINPLFSLAAVVAAWKQISLVSSAGHVGALSTAAIGLQCVIFALLALSWPFRLRLPGNLWRLGGRWILLRRWYPWVGWSCVNSAVVAVGQAVLFFVVRDAGGHGKGWLGAGEGESLLRGLR